MTLSTAQFALVVNRDVPTLTDHGVMVTIIVQQYSKSDDWHWERISIISEAGLSYAGILSHPELGSLMVRDTDPLFAAMERGN